MSVIEEKCKQKGVRLTEQRRVIAKVMSESKLTFGSKDHPDVDELHKRVTLVDKKMGGGMMKRKPMMAKKGKAVMVVIGMKPKKKMGGGMMMKKPMMMSGGLSEATQKLKAQGKMGGGMMQRPMMAMGGGMMPGYKKGKSVMAKGCKLGRKKPTKMYT